MEKYSGYSMDRLRKAYVPPADPYDFDELDIGDMTVPEDYWGEEAQPFWRPGANPTVDTIAVKNNPETGEQEILLIKRSSQSLAEPGKWALPGGFVETDAPKGSPWETGKTEEPVNAALRELHEETGLDLDVLEKNMKFIGTYGDWSKPTGRDPRDNEKAWSVSHSFLLYIPDDFRDADKIQGMDDAEAASWVPISEVRVLNLAFDHKDMLRAAGLI